MDNKIINSMFYGNVNYYPEGSFKVHTIKQNSTNVPDCIGFKINIGNNNTHCSADNFSLLKQLKKKDIQCLKSWTVIKKNTLFSNLLKIKGKLCEPKNTISGKIHYAGFIKKTIKKDLIKTTNGKYRLVGPPAKLKTKTNERFYTFWMIAGGFPQKFNKL